MSLRVAVLALVLSFDFGHAKLGQDGASMSQPIVELRLAPPTHPQPQVVAELAVLETARDKLEARFWERFKGKI